MNRVVITGIGVVSPVGCGRQHFWHSLTNGVSGIGPISHFDASTFPVQIAGEVKTISRKSLATKFPEAATERDRKIWLGLAAIDEAISSSHLTASQLNQASIHVGVGLETFFLEDITPAAYSDDMSDALVQRITSETSNLSLQTPLDRLTQIIGKTFGIRGGRFTNCSACAASAQAIGEAFHALQEGSRSVAIAGGADSMLNPLGMGGFSLLGALSTENEQPTRACRPFDASREGTVLGEGAAFLVLETLDHAIQRNAFIFAEILGYGSSLDAYRVSDPEPDGTGATQCMLSAIEDAGLTPNDITCINAHATGTPKNDIVETIAIKRALGSHAYQIPIHAVKSMTGHMIGASGAVEAAASALTLHEGIVPPTLNLENPDPECDLDYMPDSARPFDGNTVLSNSFGFGGQNATLIFGQFPL